MQLYLTQVTNHLRQFLPDLGNEVAVDSTAVRSHSNGMRNKDASDPEASWGVKHSARSRGKDQTEYFYGYKCHAVADANYGIPLGHIVTAGNRNDSPLLPPVIDKARELLPWLKPKVIIADRQYDGLKNHDFVHQTGATAIIHIKRPARGRTVKGQRLHDGIYTWDGVPTCVGVVPMQYVGTNENGHYHYRCRAEGCYLKD